MSKVESRRVAPAAWVAAAGIGILVGFEVLVISGVYELRSSTVAKYAPWAYESFLKLVGEHPESDAVSTEKPAPSENNGASGIAGVAGFSPEAIKVNLDVEVPENPEPIPEEPVEETPIPPNDLKDAIPVG